MTFRVASTSNILMFLSYYLLPFSQKFTFLTWLGSSTTIPFILIRFSSGIHFIDSLSLFLSVLCDAHSPDAWHIPAAGTCGPPADSSPFSPSAPHSSTASVRVTLRGELRKHVCSPMSLFQKETEWNYVFFSDCSGSDDPNQNRSISK